MPQAKADPSAAAAAAAASLTPAVLPAQASTAAQSNAAHSVSTGQTPLSIALGLGTVVNKKPVARKFMPTAAAVAKAQARRPSSHTAGD